ncbi:MAG TPA: DUF2156 domain-containing protein [Fimbriimonas sp.]|nr:DUF2156 domain-containing protein [Fimbriimonas sp.]
MNEEVREHIKRCGWNSTCYQITHDALRHWWSEDRSALVGYVLSGKTAIVAGAPVCELSALSRAVEEWEAFATGNGWTVCYFGAESRLQHLLSGSKDHVSSILGSQPEWSPTEFVGAINGLRSLRAQLNRARNKSVSVREWSSDEVRNSPLLASVLSEWLESRGLPTLHFLVEPQTLSEPEDRRFFVASIQDRVVGFVTLCPVPARKGWLTEQFVRANSAPNGTVELALYEAIQAVVADGSEFVTMGIIPLVAPALPLATDDPWWLRLLKRWAQSHYSRFYNFKGLAQFKAKFLPTHWQPVVVIVRAEKFTLSHFRAVAKAFTITSPELVILRGILKAAKVELRRLRRSS